MRCARSAHSTFCVAAARGRAVAERHQRRTAVAGRGETGGLPRRRSSVRGEEQTKVQSSDHCRTQGRAAQSSDRRCDRCWASGPSATRPVR
eukprot:6938361-Prymnesium_polylepis.1